MTMQGDQRAAERLTAAADYLEQTLDRPVPEMRAMKATAGPWTTWSDLDRAYRTDVLTIEHDGRRGQLLVAQHTGPDSTYIAAMNPDVGRALIQLLRTHAAVPGSISRDLTTIADAILAAKTPASREA